jgi:hypothetical protein
MSEACCGATGDDDRNSAKLGAADWLRFAATPTFLVMALLTSVPGAGRADILCSAALASPLGGMAFMYVLMSAFHATPWLRLIAGRWRGACRS